nr:MAG TPA: hypothetical protein [Caudoviricetes sp.]
MEEPSDFTKRLILVFVVLQMLSVVYRLNKK